MLIPHDKSDGRCYSHIVEDVRPQCNMLQQLADVIARWQMEWPPQGVFIFTGRCYGQETDGFVTVGRCYCQVADGIATQSD